MERCALEYCKRRDFLPFQCTLCHKKFCLEHKDLKDHECPYQFAEGRQCNVLNATKLYNTYQTNQKMRFQSNMYANKQRKRNQNVFNAKSNQMR
ncbi:unnamed protein product (macronuclear) [Paramecium tetraurelia]|uniref:AN1-type domain-containing protein n=1 Tax=Paramecium tetraurelia TaxID=5888 RepID=A0D1N0_PARTE|nr:uncharacterized protein GSPATT00012471001 [Paramecium tetraurelia]CAK76947.1 unnamed protein product [Paramecium tetraurelia]|eukprot:XP_001444344.1 hypothetical protein (macronuclear) [Paramecium tetraurelia strain d4-2]